jgi:HPt (histidine-containing phosphotransfer) domain-containing protein
MEADANPESAHVGLGQGAPMEDGPPVDMLHLRRYTLGDRRLEREILTLFIEHAPATIAAMKQAVSDSDWTNAAHSLKGSARAVGAWRIAMLAERAERIGGIGDRSACLRVMQNIEEAATEARDHISTLGEPGDPPAA